MITLSESKTIFASFTLFIYTTFVFRSFFNKKFISVIFLFLKLEEQFFAKNVYLYVNFILEITKYKFSAAAAVIGSCQPPKSTVGVEKALDILIRYVDM